MKTSKTAMKLQVPVHERDAEANELDLILIDEFRFPHAIMSIKPEQISADELNYTYKKEYAHCNRISNYASTAVSTKLRTHVTQ